MLGLPISFALSLTETGWIICMLDEYGELLHTLHCSSDMELLKVLEREIPDYRDSLESKNGSKYLSKAPSCIPYKKPLSTYDGHTIVMNYSDEDLDDPDYSEVFTKSKKRKKKKK